MGRLFVRCTEHLLCLSQALRWETEFTARSRLPRKFRDGKTENSESGYFKIERILKQRISVTTTDEETKDNEFAQDKKQMKYT